MKAVAWPRLALSRLRRGWFAIAESTLAATLAWLLDTWLIGNPQPFFAPAAALIVLGQARGQRNRRAIEVVLGVAGGVLVADLVVQALGPQSTLTIFLVILLVHLVAVSINASTVAVVQGSVSALYLIVIAPPSHSVIPFRFVDALVGGGVALLVSHIVSVRKPLGPLLAELEALFAEMDAVLEEIATALDHQDRDEARSALQSARQSDAGVQRLQLAITAAGEALWLHTKRRERLSGVDAIAQSVSHIDFAVRNVRVLARAGLTVTRVPSPPSFELAGSVQLLKESVALLAGVLSAEVVGNNDDAARCAADLQGKTVEAVRAAASAMSAQSSLPVVMLVGQVRLTAIDLLRAAGKDDLETLASVDDALHLPPI